ncbi:MAG TPA: hypothetical protein VM029_12700 [Opitutaceae bacterium]|nr:hypothetical protein [Opitutaceae bacterium]
MLIAATIAGLALTAVLTTNLQLMRSGLRITQYSEMESQARRALEQLGHDLKSATAIKWNGASDITLTIPTSAGGSEQATYAWSAATESFFVVPGADSAVTAGRVALVRSMPALPNGGASLTFARFDRDGSAATTDLATKRIQVSLVLRRSARTMAATTQSALSATFTLRNKAVE